MKCYYCEEKKAKFRLGNGRWCCKKSSNSCPAQRQKNSKAKKGKGPWDHKPEMYSIIARCPSWNSGKTYEEVLGKRKADAFKKKLSKSLTGKSTGYASTPEKEIEKRRKLSEAIKKRYAAGWMPKAGRCKKIKYFSPIAGNITLDGTWELEFAIFLDNLKVDWKRNKNRFQYHFENKDRYYTPDFYLVKECFYVEVKGYQTKKMKQNGFNFRTH